MLKTSLITRGDPVFSGTRGQSSHKTASKKSSGGGRFQAKRTRRTRKPERYKIVGILQTKIMHIKLA